MIAGDKVRIKSAPDRVGVLTAKVQIIGDSRRWLVQFPDRDQRFPESNLELVPDNESTESLLANGSYGRVVNLRRAITHARLTGRLAEVIYSMEATNTEFYAYQFKPVLNFLESPSNGILIADEVGLGKTIEAGLIWTELRAREDVNRLLVLCPATLCSKWRDELRDRFGIRAAICDSEELIYRLEDPARLKDEFHVIASIQGTRPSKGWDDGDRVTRASARLARLIRDSAASGELFDCVIIDEAHHMRNPQTQTHKLGQLIRPATKNLILLSATPIQLRSDDLFHLLNIIDNVNFEFQSAFKNVINTNKPIMGLNYLLRKGPCTTEELIEKVDQCLLMPHLRNNRQLSKLKENPPDDEILNNTDKRIRLANRIERINLLGSAINRTRKRDVKERRVIRDVQAPPVKMTSQERSFYDGVTKGIRQYCEENGLFAGFMLCSPQHQICSSIPAAAREWQKKLQDIDDDLINSFAGEDVEGSRRNQIKKEKPRLGPLVTELAYISKAIANYEELKANDSKYRVLIETLKNYWELYPNKKVVLFSFYKATLRYLKERLTEEGINSTLIMGGMGTTKDDLKQKTVKMFKEEKSIKILLTSEVLMEGVDLQFSSTLINYDLPWNPMKVEQRIGRIDRIGQKEEKINIFNLFYEDTLDDRIYNRLFMRLQIFTEALGDTEAILGDRIAHLTHQLLSHDLTDEQQNAQIEQTRAAIANERQNQEELESEAAGLAAHGDYILNKVKAAETMKRYIDGKSLWIYVRDYLKSEYPGTKLVEKDNDPITIDIQLSLEAKSNLRNFIDSLPYHLPTKLAGNDHKPVRCMFYNQIDMGATDYEVVNQQHPLIRFIAHKSRPEDYHQLVALTLDKSHLVNAESGVYILLIQRWSTRGAKDSESLVYRSVKFDSGELMGDEFSERLTLSSIAYGQEWLNAQTAIDSKKAVGQFNQLEILLDQEFDEHCESMTMENNDRIDLAISTLEGQEEKLITEAEERIQTLRERGGSKRERMIPLQEGRIKSIRATTARRIAEYDLLRQSSKHEPSNVILAVVKMK